MSASTMPAGAVALVTGGGTGIGAAVARAFGHAGAAVLVSGRRVEALEETRDAIRREGGEAEACRADLTVRSDVAAVAEELRRRWGRVDIVVNNAGILGAHAPLTEYPHEVWDAVVATNLRSVFWVCQAVLPLMRSGGSIINVSSSVGRAGRGGWGAYAVSKFGLEGLSQVLADELRDRRIRVNTVNPGGARTAMRAAAYPDEDPLSLPPPEALTPVFLFLASSDSEGVTGQMLDARGFSPSRWTAPRTAI